MFKELGEFIDNVGRATGRMIGQTLSDKDDDDGILMGYPTPDIGRKLEDLGDSVPMTTININDNDNQ